MSEKTPARTLDKTIDLDDQNTLTLTLKYANSFALAATITIEAMTNTNRAQMVLILSIPQTIFTGLRTKQMKFSYCEIESYFTASQDNIIKAKHAATLKRTSRKGVLTSVLPMSEFAPNPSI